MQSWIKYFKSYKGRIITIIVLGLVLYGVTLGNQMFWDDNDFIVNNSYIHDWENVGRYFSENLIAGAGLVSNYWRPVLLMVFAGEWSVWGNWAAGFHLVNMIFHIANALLLYSLLRKILKSKTIAWLSAIIFLIHPLQTEAVTYVNSLGDSLSTFFIFSGLIWYLKFRQTGEVMYKSWQYWLTIGCYILALLSKEISITMPGLVMLVDFFTISPTEKFWVKIKAIVKRVWPLLVIAGIYLILRATALNFNNSFNFYTDDSEFGSNIFIRLLTFGRIFITYLGLMLAPWSLHMERTVTVARSIFEPMVIAGWISLGGIIYAAIKLYRVLPAISLGLIWFLITLIPVSNIIVPINGMLYEHWLYVPLIGFFIALVSIGNWLYKKPRYRWPMISLMLIIIIFFSVRTIKRNIEWADPIRLYTQTIKYSPNSYRVLNNLGMEYANRGDAANAEKYYLQAIDADDSVAVAYHNLANLRRGEGRYDDAIELYKTAISKQSDFIYAMAGMAQTYELKKDYANAIDAYEQVMDYYPNEQIIQALIELSAKVNDTERVNQYTNLLRGS